MMTMPILSILTFLPLLGVLMILTLRGEAERVHRHARAIALYISGVNFLLSLVMLHNFDSGTAGFQLVEKFTWFAPLNLTYHLGVDGISVYFVALSAFLTPICILSAWAQTNRLREFMAAFLVLETFMIGTFCALDTVLFYVFFEGVLLPMFLIIGVWGGERRVYASYKFFLYTLLGSVLMLLAMLWLYANVGTDIPDIIAKADIPADIQFWLFLAFFASFAVKMPMWPVHTWLPDAHVEAPTAGSVILAGVLLKMGGYGFLRFSLPMFPDASLYFTPMIMTLSVIAIIYTSLVALVQEDMKKLIAYSSVAHMGFVTMGIFAGNVAGVQGAVFQMLSHGIVSAALFLCVGVVYDRLHTRRIAAYGGMVNNMPRYAVVFMILTLGAVGLPGTSGFVGEFLALVGAFGYSTWVALLAGTGVILGAAYMLNLYRAVLFGPATNPDAAAMPDMNRREVVMFLPLIIMVIWFGIMPNSILHTTEGAAKQLVNAYENAFSLPTSVAHADKPAEPAALPAAPVPGNLLNDEAVKPTLPVDEEIAPKDKHHVAPNH
jgi:NADH-quinone oxidoreductase subunit M